MNFEFKSKFSKFQLQKKKVYQPLEAFDDQDQQDGEDNQKNKLRQKFSTIYNDSSSSQIKDENEDEEEEDDDEEKDNNDNFNNQNQNQNGVILQSSQKIQSQANVQSQHKIKIEKPSENQIIDLKLVNQWGQRIIEQKKQNQKLLPVDQITEQALFTFGRFVFHGQEKGENQKLNSTNLENQSILKSQINKASIESRFNPVKVINTDKFLKRRQNNDIKKQKEGQKQGETLMNRSFPLPSRVNQTTKEYRRSNSPPSQMPQIILNSSFDPSQKLDITKFDIQYLQSIKYIKPDIVIQVEEEQRNKIHIFQNSFKIIQLNCKNQESPLTLKIKIQNSFSLHLFVGQVEDQCWTNYDQYYCSYDKPIHYNFQEDKQKIYITILSQSPFCNLELIYYFNKHKDQQINTLYQPNNQDILPRVEESNIQLNVQHKKEELSTKHISVLPAINQDFISKNISILDEYAMKKNQKMKDFHNSSTIKSVRYQTKKKLLMSEKQNKTLLEIFKKQEKFTEIHNYSRIQQESLILLKMFQQKWCQIICFLYFISQIEVMIKQKKLEIIKKEKQNIFIRRILKDYRLRHQGNTYLDRIAIQANYGLRLICFFEEQNHIKRKRDELISLFFQRYYQRKQLYEQILLKSKRMQKISKIIMEQCLERAKIIRIFKIMFNISLESLIIKEFNLFEQNQIPFKIFAFMKEDIMKCQLEIIKEYYQKKRFAFLKKYSVYYQNITQLNYTHRVLVDIINSIKYFIHNKKYKNAIYERYESQENCELSNEAINIIKSNQIYLECEENKLLAEDIKKYFVNSCWQYNPSKQNLNQILYQLKQALNLNEVGYRNDENLKIYRRQNQISFTNIVKIMHNNNGQKQHQNLTQQQQLSNKSINMYHKQYKEIIQIQQSLQQQKQNQSQKAIQQNNKLKATNIEIEHLGSNQTNQSNNQVDNSINVLPSLRIIQDNQQINNSQTNYTQRSSIMKIQKIPQNTKGKQNSKQDSSSTGVKKNNQKTKLKLRPTTFDKILKESLKPSYEPFIYQKEFEKEIVLHSYKLIKRMIENKKKDLQQKLNQFQKQKVVVKNKIKKAEVFKQNNQYLNSDHVVWTPQQKLKIIKLLSLISSAWTILNNEDQSKTRKYVHKVQIVVIMRILNIDLEQESKLQNHVLEIRTGEGKSIIFGISAIIFALIGFSIDCCCYSQYLSERDQRDFQSFFKLFNVQGRICYNKFKKLTEKMFNTPFQLTEIGKSHILKNDSMILKQVNNQTGKRILFIDEVDFFFDKDFLGKVYPVVLQISNPEIIKLFRYIWKYRYTRITLDQVKKSNEYSSLINNYQNLKHLTNLIDLKIEQMIEDANNMENHSYILSDVPGSQEKVIGYKHIDGYRYDIVKRFKTSFAYYVEYQLQNIQKSQLNKVLNLNFNLGCFSYCKILYGYSTIIGVSEKLTILPSVFGKSHLKFNHQQDIHVIQNEKQYYDQISLQINNEIKKNRAVIVFFENQYKLNAFRQQFKPYNNFEIQILDEKSNDKQHLVSKAALSQVLTLSTNSFGRGTDFECFDDIIKDNGGIHIIQTFLSETETGLIQVQGRAARNGENGSYSLIILHKSLELSFGFKQDISSDNKYQQLQQIIQLKQQQQGQKLEKNLKESEQLHSKSQQLKQLLEEQYVSKKDLGVQINKILKEISEISDSKDSFVNQHSQQQNQGYQLAQKDKFGDPIGENFDLAKNGSCQSKKILIGQFGDTSSYNVTSDLQQQYKKALELKGFQVFQVETDEQVFSNQIQYYDQIQIFSGFQFNNQLGGLTLEKKFVEEVIKHLEKGKGLMLWSENDPFYYHANLILNKLPIGYEDQQPIYMNLQGNDIGGKNLTLGEFNQRLQFGEPPIVKGLLGIFEGNTICYPKIKGNLKEYNNYQDYYDLQIVGTGSEMRPCMFVLNATRKRDRVVFDCGYTKVFRMNWDMTRGTQRYEENCY
ncbi:hypothetical protein ABPG72_011009, partial [Tetrahymena utriculariae]